MTSVAIVGCGYLGLELGRQLAADGKDVVGVRRSRAGLDAVEHAGLTPVRADATDAKELSAVSEVDAVVFAASGDDRRATLVGGLRTVIEAFGRREAPPDRLVYTSSTGVYGDHDGGWVDETTPPRPTTERERVLLEAEEVALERSDEVGIRPTVARLGGIYGTDRYGIERYLDGPIIEGYRNAIHRDDAAGALAYLLERGLANGEIVNVVDDHPIRRGEFAAWLAEALGRSAPSVVSDPDNDQSSGRTAANKRVSNAKLRALGVELAYPTVREGYARFARD